MVRIRSIYPPGETKKVFEISLSGFAVDDLTLCNAKNYDVTWMIAAICAWKRKKVKIYDRYLFTS